MFDTKILDGKLVSSILRRKLTVQVEELHDKVGQKPGLALICVGDNPASRMYIKTKVKACKEVGITSSVIIYPDDCSQKILLDLLL